MLGGYPGHFGLTTYVFCCCTAPSHPAAHCKLSCQADSRVRYTGRACAEGFKLPGSKNAESARSKLEAAEKGFAESEILKTLREKTGLNKAKYS